VVIVALVAAIIHAGNERAKTDNQNRELREQIQKLQQDIQQLNKELKDAQAAKIQRQEEARVESARLASVRRVRSFTGGTCAQYQPLISQYSWNIEIAVAVCNAESGGVASKNHADDNHKICLGSRGLFQIGCDSTANFDAMFDPAANIAQAYNLYANRGWKPWSVCTNGTVSCW
jgi:TolA-binding protein